jgi:hypothetical protein
VGRAGRDGGGDRADGRCRVRRIEGPVPESAAGRRRLAGLLAERGLGWIAEVTTGLRAGGPDDWWVPAPGLSVEDHLAELREGAERAADLGAWFVTTMCGYDAWSLAQNVDFFGRALEIERGAGIGVHFETHRCRSLFNPWITRDLLELFPAMTLTCDFSHWCVVAERLIDTEMDVLLLCAERAAHIHGRVGWAQGAQVPDPREPRFRRALEAHERWWDLLWAAQARRGLERSTMNIEWGPDGYTPLLPYTEMPMVDRWEIIRWMAARQRSRFADGTARRETDRHRDDPVEAREYAR